MLSMDNSHSWSLLSVWGLVVRNSLWIWAGQRSVEAQGGRNCYSFTVHDRWGQITKGEKILTKIYIVCNWSKMGKEQKELYRETTFHHDRHSPSYKSFFSIFQSKSLHECGWLIGYSTVIYCAADTSIWALNPVGGLLGKAKNGPRTRVPLIRTS